MIELQQPVKNKIRQNNHVQFAQGGRLLSSQGLVDHSVLKGQQQTTILLRMVQAKHGGRAQVLRHAGQNLNHQSLAGAVGDLLNNKAWRKPGHQSGHPYSLRHPYQPMGGKH